MKEPHNIKGGFMKNKGYTIIEAVIAMFLVVIMVGAVFSALMAGRRALVASSEKEEVLYTMQSSYNMIKDCRNNNDCLLRSLGCTDIDDLRNCEGLFTYSFQNVCEHINDNESEFSYDLINVNNTGNKALFYGQTSFNDVGEVEMAPILRRLDMVSFCNL